MGSIPTLSPEQGTESLREHIHFLRWTEPMSNISITPASQPLVPQTPTGQGSAVWQKEH